MSTLAAALAEQGFATTGPILEAAELPPLHAAIERIFERCSAAMGDRERWLKVVNQVRDPELWDPCFAALKADPRLARVASEALGEPARPAWLHLVWKRPACTLHLPWHVDRPTWPTEIRACNAVALWLALDESGPERGGLKYAPGSHIASTQRCEAIACPEVPAGAGLLHHPDVLHASAGNPTDQWRRACVFVYTGRTANDAASAHRAAG